MQRHEVIIHSHEGPVAEWLCSGLQNRGHRFNSGLGLHHFPINRFCKRGFLTRCFIYAIFGGLQNHRDRFNVGLDLYQKFQIKISLTD